MKTNEILTKLRQNLSILQKQYTACKDSIESEKKRSYNQLLKLEDNKNQQMKDLQSEIENEKLRSSGCNLRLLKLNSKESKMNEKLSIMRKLGDATYPRAPKDRVLSIIGGKGFQLWSKSTPFRYD